MARKKGAFSNIAECSKYTWTFCEQDKRIVDKMQTKYKEKHGLFLSMERAIKRILIEWNEAQ